MADLEAVLADVSYLIAMEKSKSAPSASVTKKIVLADKSVSSVITRYLKRNNKYNFNYIFNTRHGFLLFKEFCYQGFYQPITEIQFYEEILNYEKIESNIDRLQSAKKIYDGFIMPELLAHDFKFSEAAATTVQKIIYEAGLSDCGRSLPTDIFDCIKQEIEEYLEANIFQLFLKSEKYVRFSQWVHFELTMQLTMSDFSLHRIIGRGGFGEVYGCRKTDTGKMYAMKCLDKKRIKMKQGEGLALNEMNILRTVSIGSSACPFIVSMTYAFQTTDKLCFILDLMNGGDLHYHLTQHGIFTEDEVRFYTAEIILGLEHMHSRSIVYRDLKPANVLLDERGHVRISDLGLACDFSLKKPQASVGTHGYMAPEVHMKGVQYDSAADFFSLGCLMFKLLRGHSPFRLQQKSNCVEYEQTIREITRECRETLSNSLCSLLTGLLVYDPNLRLGGRGADEIKSHSFFNLNWHHVYNQMIVPPIIPPKGEVNAADAFDIGNFDEDDTKGIKLTDIDQVQYKNFFAIISDRWQQEVEESVFESVNAETDRLENKKNKQLRFRHAMSASDSSSDIVLHGIVRKGSEGSFGYQWQVRYAKLFPNRLELYSDRSDRQVEVYTMENIISVESKEFAAKLGVSNRVLILRTNRSSIPGSPMCGTVQALNLQPMSSFEDVLFLFQDEITLEQWADALEEAKTRSTQQLISSGRASKIYGEILH